MIVMKEEGCYTHRSLETGGAACPAESYGKPQGRWGGRGRRETVGKSLHCGFRGKEWARQGEQIGQFE